jgi:hypothetical protein
VPRRRLIELALPALVALTPVLVGAFRDWSDRSGIWLWGDQALIDIEARNTLLGRNLLGVYDRYGWHHLGPLWLFVLGVARWLGGGSAVGTAMGFYFLQTVAIVAIMLTAYRLRHGLTAWWTALVVVGYEWSFGLERLGTLWAPYVIALPTALLVLLVADIAANPDPWPPTIGAAICATFLAQTDVGTLVVVAVLVVAAPFVRLATRAAVEAGRQGARARSPGAAAWGWGTTHWRSRAATLTALLGVLWLPSIIQQLSTRPGNLVQAYRFLTTHHTIRTLAVSLRAADTLFGLFPFRLDGQPATRDARPRWLLTHPVWDHPWYLLYLAGTIVVAAAAFAHRRLPALAVAVTTALAILAAGWSILLVFGPLYPYLVLWTGALVIPAWVAVWLVVAPSLAPARHDTAAEARPSPLPPPPPPRRLIVPVASVVAAVAVCAAFSAGDAPLTDGSAHLARRSWAAVAGPALAARVKTVYVEIGTQNAMPEAAAIADELIRHHRRVEINRNALYYLDPSFVPRWKAQLRIVVCCTGDTSTALGRGLDLRAEVGDQRIYISSGRSTSRPAPPAHDVPAPELLRLRAPGYLIGDADDRAHHPMQATRRV